MFFSAHVPLALLMNQVREVGTLHALLTLGAGLWYALLGRDVVKVALVGAYITGAEVLWRMVDAGVIWEFGKYATIATFAIGIVRLHGLKGTKLPLVYFLVMLPSGILTLSELGLDDARDQVSFNLSGPLALMVCAWFFSQVRLSTEQLQRLFLVAIGPIVGIATIALYSTFTAVSIRWSDESNFVTSGGFGPNQVSNALGLGALLAFVFIRQGKVSRFLQALMFAAVLVFGTLSALTFSRSGLYNAGAAAAVLLLFSIRDRAALVRVGLSLVALFLLVDNFILPNLQEFTGGAILTRFQDTGLTHRQEIAEADLQVWMHNPLFGVGPGMAKEARALFLDPVAAHTEVTRLLAEHGFFGLIAFLLLLVMSYQNYRRAQGTAQKGFVAAMVVWTMLFMLNSAMRLVAPALIFGLTFGYLPADDGVNHAQTSAGLATALV
ncbi:MAG TPA: O-antigen ligase family protein [Chloroflexia bacterium]